jgi:hypothetical protein
MIMKIKSNKQGYSQELKDLTYRVIDQVEISSFYRNFTILKNIEKGFGKLDMIDAINYKYEIKDMESNQIIETYSTLDDLIRDGWVID